MPRRARVKKIEQTILLNDVIIDSIHEKKGEEVICLDLRSIDEAIVDFFIICHANNTTQVNAIAENIMRKTQEKSGEKPWHNESTKNSEWILLDYVSTVVHIFYKKTRQYYNLEDLWSDAKLKKYIG